MIEAPWISGSSPLPLRVDRWRGRATHCRHALLLTLYRGILQNAATPKEQYERYEPVENSRQRVNSCCRQGVNSSCRPTQRPDSVAGVRGLELGNVIFQNARPNSLVFQNILVPETFRVFDLHVLVNDRFVLGE
jgi:hypothetical protein